MFKKTLALLLCVALCWIAVGCFQTDDLHDLINDDAEKADNATLRDAAIELCYEVLGIEQNANLKEIEKAFKRRALKYHPDKGGNVKAFYAIETAREELKKYLEQENASEDSASANDDENVEQTWERVKKTLEEGLELIKIESQINGFRKPVNNDVGVAGTTPTMDHID